MRRSLLYRGKRKSLGDSSWRYSTRCKRRERGRKKRGRGLRLKRSCLNRREGPRKFSRRNKRHSLNRGSLRSSEKERPNKGKKRGGSSRRSSRHRLSAYCRNRLGRCRGESRRWKNAIRRGASSRHVSSTKDRGLQRKSDSKHRPKSSKPSSQLSKPF